MCKKDDVIQTIYLSLTTIIKNHLNGAGYKVVTKIFQLKKNQKKINIAIRIININQGEREEEEILKDNRLIQRFDYKHELAWKVTGDYAEYQVTQQLAAPEMLLEMHLKWG